MSETKKIRIALCGCEGHVERFGNLVNSYEESETVAVWDPIRERAQRVADAVGNCKVETDYDALLSSPEIDGVVITTTNNYHAEMVLKAAKAGKNVFVEKPLCLNVEDAYAIKKAVAESNIKFYMSDPFVEATTIYLKEFIRSGKLGDLLSVRIRFSSNQEVVLAKTPEEITQSAQTMGGGMMSNTGGHPLHVINYLLGKPEKIFAHFAYGSETARENNYDQYIALLLEYPNSVYAFIESGMISPDYTNEVEICGTKGIIVDRSVGDHLSEISYKLCTVTADDFKTVDPREVFKKDQWVKVSPEELVPKPDDHIRYWVKMQAYNIPNDMVGVDNASTHGVGLEQSVELVEMREAIYRSAASGKPEIVR